MSATLDPCVRCDSPLEAGDVLCAVCGKLAPAPAPEPASAADGPKVEVLRCSECGAAARWDARERGLTCAFCGAVAEREELVDPPEQAQACLPFTVDRTEARGALRRWLGTGGFFRPGDLKSEAQLESLRPLWWVAWIFDADALVSWTADSNAGSRRSDWAPHAGQTRMVFDDVAISASRGLADEESRALAGSYDLRTGRGEPAFEGNGGADLEEATIEAFDVQRSGARGRVLEAIRAHAAERVEAECVPGTRFRKVQAALLLRGLETRRVALPAWVLAYRYRERLYRVVISGQDAACLHGRMPVSPWRVLAVVLAVLAAATLVAALVAARG